MFRHEIMSEVRLLTLLVFWLGLVVGSFLNVLVLRLRTGESVARGRSRCFSCGRKLGALELVPLFSFLVQKAKCKHCGSRLSWQYPAIEFLSGLVFTLVAWKILELGAWSLEPGSQVSALQVPSFGFEAIRYLYWVTIFSLLLAISVYDIRHRIIPNEFVYPLIILALFAPIFNVLTVLSSKPQIFLPGILSGLGAFIFFAGLWFFSGGAWMGFGDAKLALAIGFFLGYPLTIAGVIFSFWIGTLVMLPAVLARGRSLKMQIPFAPFLAAGALAAWLWSTTLTAYYSIFM